MLTLDDCKIAAISFITDNSSEEKLIENIDLLKNILTNKTKIKLCGFLSRLKRAKKHYTNKKSSYKAYTKIVDKIEDSVIEIFKNLNKSDLFTYFNYIPNDGLVYYFYQQSEIFIYRGNLLNGKPNGKGEMLFPNGEKYIGEFKEGLKHGGGNLYDKTNFHIKEGTWENDKFINPKSIVFFPFTKAAAGQKDGLINGQISDFKRFNLPYLEEENLFAFPIVGCSMEPEYFEGDIVVCKEIKQLNELVNNEVYIVYNHEELFLKIVKKNLYDSKLTLSSINYIDNPPFNINPNSQTKIYKIKVHLKYNQNKSFKHIPHSEMIPCVCDECKNSATPYYFDYTILQRYERKGRSQIDCPISVDAVSIRALLDGVFNLDLKDLKGKFKSGKIEAILEILLNNLHDESKLKQVNMLSSQWNDNENDHHSGILDERDYRLVKNKIKHSILKFLA